VALEFREHFREVYTDEYQDTNDVQETILRLVSKGDTADDPRAGNRFMVGDVKQSIYRFRLAEPGLFIHKYKTYAADSHKHHLTDSLSSPSVGSRIDLARNFRSRKEVVDTVNLIFRQIMHEEAAEIDYDPQAELIYGAHYAPFNSNHDLATELLIIDHSANAAADEDEASFEASEDQQENEDSVELETAESEAQVIAERIRQLLGKTGLPPMEVADKSSRGARPLQYRDIVILLRADKAWAPMFVEQFKQSGIPVYAELAGGYFDALEIRTMLAILQTIDNPLQDIPLATSLTLPMFALTHEQLAQVRLWGGREATFYESLGKAVADEALLALNNPSLHAKIKYFLITLELWRNFARQHSLADLILTLYRDSGYLDYVGGLPGGTQRQANLRALYDRARQYESTSFRGLFRFLRFIERLRASKADLAPARALGEQEDVVRIMTVHKSKGLEFPVVFVAGLGKKFNRTDERASFLIHKQLGFGPRFVLPDQGVAYPSLPLHAIRRRLRAEAMAEEMRILYVALTRAREKLIMTGSVKSLPKKLVKWQNIAAQPGTRIAASAVRQAENFIDWLLPAFLRTPISATFRHENGLDAMPEFPRESATEAQSWKVLIVKPNAATHIDSSPRQINIEEQQWLERLERVPDEWTIQHQAVEKMLGWTDPHALATKLSAKTSVTQWKRRLDEAAGEDLDIRGSAPLKRPRFMEAQGLSPLERGVAYHTVMQHVPLNQPIQVEQMSQFLADLVFRELLTEEQRKAIDEVAVCQFFASEPGLMLMGAVQVMRELPFSVQLPVRLVYGDKWNDTAIDEDLAQEPVLVQGVIDCMFEVADGLVILDYKTDRIAPDELQEAAERYRHQLAVYKQAVEISIGRPVTHQYLYFFSIAKAIQL
jgi:ATP-dependent helicase/nuclease subunit A